MRKTPDTLDTREKLARHRRKYAAAYEYYQQQEDIESWCY